MSLKLVGGLVVVLLCVSCHFMKPDHVEADMKMMSQIEMAKEATSNPCNTPHFKVVRQIEFSTIPTTVVYAGVIVEPGRETLFDIESDESGNPVVLNYNEENGWVRLRQVGGKGIVCP